jgi:hypothetical protein
MTKNSKIQTGFGVKPISNTPIFVKYRHIFDRELSVKPNAEMIATCSAILYNVPIEAADRRNDGVTIRFLCSAACHFRSYGTAPVSTHL